MKYFLDTEFIEGFKKPISWLPTIGKFNKPYHSIQLISIGIVAEDGREFYAISNEFNIKDANDWIVENVLEPIYDENERKIYNISKRIPGLWYDYKDYTPRRLKRLLEWKGKSNKQIAIEVRNFIYNSSLIKGGQFVLGKFFPSKIEGIEFYAYFADYDWVVFCSLFGTMMDLPKGFPKYCKDLKQELDEYTKPILEKMLFESKDENFLCFEPTIDAIIKLKVKHLSGYPKKKNEHNALGDAKWNKKLYDFLAL